MLWFTVVTTLNATAHLMNTFLFVLVIVLFNPHQAPFASVEGRLVVLGAETRFEVGRVPSLHALAEPRMVLPDCL